jgi:hypothetical protein
MQIGAIKVIRRAEDELRAQAQRALTEGRYRDVAIIARLADDLAQLAERESLSNGSTVDATNPVVPCPNRSSVSRRSQVMERNPKSFPRFEREGERLVKVAWSKRDRSHYEHKAPFNVVNLLIAAIRSKKGVGARFTAPDVLPLIDPRSGTEIPSYQSYLALGWLRHEGVVVKYGRDTYSLKPMAATEAHIAELWEGLPSRD